MRLQTLGQEADVDNVFEEGGVDVAKLVYVRAGWIVQIVESVGRIDCKPIMPFLEFAVRRRVARQATFVQLRDIERSVDLGVELIRTTVAKFDTLRVICRSGQLLKQRHSRAEVVRTVFDDLIEQRI